MTAGIMKIEYFAMNDWPELIPLDALELPSLDASILPVWAGAFAQSLAENTETPPELAIGMILAVCSTAVARRLKVQVRPGYIEPCNLWIVVTLPSGTRKSAVLREVMAPLAAWEREQAARLEPEIRELVSKRRTLDARLKELRQQAAKAKDAERLQELTREIAELESTLPDIPALPRLWTSDATPERLGALMAEQGGYMAWLSAEGGIFDLLQGRYTNGIPNLDLILKAHSGDPERVDRGGREPVILDNPLLTIGLCPQPDVLRGLAGKSGFRGRGLLARFLFLLPRSPLGCRTFESSPIPEAVRAAYYAGLHAMLNWGPASAEHENDQRHAVRLSEDAHEVWLAFARSIEERMNAGGDLEHCKDWAGKAPGAAARLAGVLHGIKHAHEEPWAVEISSETMQAAIRIMEVIISHSVAALNAAGADRSIVAAKQVWEWIEQGQRECFTIRDAFNGMRSVFPRVEALKKALTILEERGYVQIIEPPREGRGRPPSPVVQVRPELVRKWQR